MPADRGTPGIEAAARALSQSGGYSDEDGPAFWQRDAEVAVAAFLAAEPPADVLKALLEAQPEAMVEAFAEAMWDAHEVNEPSGERDGFTEDDLRRSPVFWKEAEAENRWPASRAEQRKEARLMLDLLTQAAAVASLKPKEDER